MLRYRKNTIVQGKRYYRVFEPLGSPLYKGSSRGAKTLLKNKKKMDYSLNPRKMSVGPLKGQTVYVPSLVCQKEQISFEELCAAMAEDSTVGEVDVAAVVYKGWQGLKRFFLLGYIVDAGPSVSFTPRSHQGW